MSQMSVMCLSDGSHWPATTAEYQKKKKKISWVNFSSAVDQLRVCIEGLYVVTVVLLLFFLDYFFGFYIEVCLATLILFLAAVWSSELDTLIDNSCLWIYTYNS